MRKLRYGRDDMAEVISRKGIDYSAARQTAQQILDEVKAEGDAAVLRYTAKFDKVELASIKVSKQEMVDAVHRIDEDLRTALLESKANLEKVHLSQLASMSTSWETEVEPGVMVGERLTPIKSAGCYVPGGRASYPSTVLMCVIPAKIAGVDRVVVATPPPISDAVLAACHIAGADQVIACGGAQAIAAMAYGTESVKSVRKIVGPGNVYVTAAKTLVYGTCDIDMPAGPSEILIVADAVADPGFIAADILAQAEHDPHAQLVLVTDSEGLVGAVAEVVKELSASSERSEILSESLPNLIAVLTHSVGESCEFANEYAPEHLEIHTKDSHKMASRIRDAGAIFIGPYSPVAAGDYATGANHVLPTSGAAKYSGQLSIRDFLKSTSIQMLNRKGLKRLSKTILTLSKHEGLFEHGRSVSVRI